MQTKHICVLINILTNGKVGAVKLVQALPVKYFTDRFKVVLLLWIILYCLCLVIVILSCLFIAALWSSIGKGVASWLLFVLFNCVFVTFPCGILGQERYLIVSIPGICRRSYFGKLSMKLVIRIAKFDH